MQNNYFQFLVVEQGYYTESNSKFTNNESLFGGTVFLAIDRSVNTFTNTEFSNNISPEGFGAVIAC